DKDGELIQRHKQRSHSWTRNAYNIMFCQLAGKDGDDVTFGAGKLCFKKTTGAIDGDDRPCLIGDATVDATTYGYRAAAGIVTRGILVGQGEDAESFEDYVLQTPILEGTGANQLNHVTSEAHAISYAALTLKNELVRYFNNNSGGDIDVNEVALVTNYISSYCALTSRDKLASTVTIPSTGQLKVTYTIQLTYPA
ncbi:MAG TPA: hypothetical protein VMV84_01045, partial [Dehalococcoidales bacterium]|nr:hypothetical protein [Dehalococcoidales bacterium]